MNAPLQPLRPFALRLKGKSMNILVTPTGAAALAMCLALGVGAAVAQDRPPQLTAQNYPPGPPSGYQGGQGQLPSKMDLVSPEPQWAKQCAKEPSTGLEVCSTTRDFGVSADQPPMVSVNVAELQGEEKRKLRLMMPTIGLMMQPGFRVIIDNGQPLEGKYGVCFQNSCLGEVDIGSNTLDALKKGQTVSIVSRVADGGPSGRDLTLNIALTGLGPEFDGKPTDPQVLEQQRQQMQQRFQRGAEEQRRYMQQQGGSTGSYSPMGPGAPAR
jgi:invasion protein IalB